MTYEQIQAIQNLMNSTTELDVLLPHMEELVEAGVTDENELDEYLNELIDNIEPAHIGEDGLTDGERYGV